MGPRRAAEILDRQNIVSRRKAPKPKLSAEYRNLKSALRKKVRRIPTLQLSLEELKDLIVSMAEVTRIEGLQALESFTGESARLEGLLKEGLMLAVDGMEQEKVTSLLMSNYETRCRMIIGGIASLQQGDNPRVVEHMLAAFYKPRADSV